VRSTRWLVVVLALAAACAEAGGASTGGELTPRGAQATIPPVFVPPEASTTAADASASCGSGGSKWSELYADIFGSTKPGGCNSELTCHGSADAQGALDADGILCISAAGCRQSLIDQRLATPADQTNPTDAKIFTKLRSVNNLTPPAGQDDLMPKAPADYVFSQACLDRITAWVANGVPDD
jgi:hypothetical protein